MYDEGLRIVIVGLGGVFAVLICLYMVIVILGKSLSVLKTKGGEKSGKS